MSTDLYYVKGFISSPHYLVYTAIYLSFMVKAMVGFICGKWSKKKNQTPQALTWKFGS
jgi:hypothetical protein